MSLTNNDAGSQPATTTNDDYAGYEPISEEEMRAAVARADDEIVKAFCLGTKDSFKEVEIALWHHYTEQAAFYASLVKEG
jgi:hypothetical protein